MLIINSKKKDYYDGVVGTMGIDKTIVYDRKEEILEPLNKDYPSLFLSHRWNEKKNPFMSLGDYGIKMINYDAYSFFIVGFCGQLYVGWKFYKEVKDNKLIETITYNFNIVKDNINNLVHRNSNINDNMADVLLYDPIEIFRKYKTPIFVYDHDYNRTYLGKYYRQLNHRFIINPNLDRYEFYKKFNSFDAFQEIQMFLSGVLGNSEKEIIKVADKYKIEQHGFDKWSFRKEKIEK